MCGKAWSALPTLGQTGELQAPIDLLVTTLLSLFSNVQAGLIVASSDVLLLVPPGFQVHWPQHGVTGLAIPTDVSYGPHHGCYQASPQRVSDTDPSAVNCYRVSRFWQKASVAELTAGGAVRPADGTVLIDSGVVYFSPSATGTLLALAEAAPLDCCTYRGVDMGRSALRIELYSDMMMALDGGLGLTKEQYHATPISDALSPLNITSWAREVLWEALTPLPFHALVLEGGGFAHVGTSSEYLTLLTRPSGFAGLYGLTSRAAVYVQQQQQQQQQQQDDGPSSGISSVGSLLASLTSEATPTFTALNSVLVTSPGVTAAACCGGGSVVEHSHLTGAWSIGPGCLVSSVRSLPSLVVRGGTALQELRVAKPNMPGGVGRVVSVLAVLDPIKDAFTKPSARINGLPWKQFLAIAGVSEEDIWPGSAHVDAPSSCTIWTAKLFPVTPVEREVKASHNEPTLADRSCLWLQWAAPLTAAEAAHPSAVACRASALAPEVLHAWRCAERMSLKDILGAADATVEFGWRRDLRGRIDVASLITAAGMPTTVQHISTGSVAALVKRLGRTSKGPAPPPHEGFEESLITAAAAGAGAGGDGFGSSEGASSVAAAAASALSSPPPPGPPGYNYGWLALRGLDLVAAACPADVAARALSVSALLLWAIAGWGTHAEWSGPAHNPAWTGSIFKYLEAEGVGQRAFSHQHWPQPQQQAISDDNASPSASTPSTPPRKPRNPLADSASVGSPTASASRTRAKAVAAMARLRDVWSARPHGLGRAARHYERACQLLTSQCVFTAPVAPPTSFPHAAAVAALDAATGHGPWVTATAPARVDLAGGWSDTPPITYEAPPPPASSSPSSSSSDSSDSSNDVIATVSTWCGVGGGLVVNAAVTVDGRRPLGTRVRRVRLMSPAQPLIVIRTRAEGKPDAEIAPSADSVTSFLVGSGGAGAAPNSTSDDAADPTAPRGTAVVSSLPLRKLSDLHDYCQPRAEGALVKSALLVLPAVIDISVGAAPLDAQLTSVLGEAGVGLEIETWSLLPTGSGLGTSSILAGTLLAALAGALGRSYDLRSLSHAVLGLEGMLSTGGGWQDQVGGLWPGVKASACAPALPLQVTALPLHPADDVSLPSFLSQRLFLVYTGKTRLAKNLLQTVLRQWAGRDADVTATVEALRTNALTMAQALQARDDGAVGACLAAYWEQKKRMAPNAEPPEVAAMRAVLAPHVSGVSLAGAGGGGFMFGLAKEAGGDVAARIDAILRSHPSTAGLPFSVHAASVDTRGLVVEVEGVQ